MVAMMNLHTLKYRVTRPIRDAKLKAVAAWGRFTHPKGYPYPVIKDPELWLNHAIDRWGAIPMGHGDDSVQVWEHDFATDGKYLGHHRVWVDINDVSRVLFAGVDAYLTDTFRTHPEIPADIMGCRFETDYDLEDGCVLVQSSNSKIMGNRVKSRGPVTFKVVSEESCC